MPNHPVTEKVYRNPGNPQILRWIPQGARTVLDVGCGAGENARLISALGAAVDGVTLSEGEAAIARSHLRAVHLHNLEGGLPPEMTGTYDAVTASHVLEHLCFPEALLRDVRARLAPGGVLIVAIPNMLTIKYRLRLLLGRIEYEAKGIMDNTHFRWYTFRSFQELLTAHGFQVVEAYGDGYFPLPLIRRILPRPLGAAIDRFFCRHFPGLFAIQLVFVARPAAAAA